MASEIRNPNHLKSEQMAAILLKTHLKSRQKHPDFEWSGFQLVGTISIAIGHCISSTIWNTTFKKSGFQMVRFQIPTVYNWSGLSKIHSLSYEWPLLLHFFFSCNHYRDERKANSTGQQAKLQAQYRFNHSPNTCAPPQFGFGQKSSIPETSSNRKTLVRQVVHSSDDQMSCQTTKCSR